MLGDNIKKIRKIKKISINTLSKSTGISLGYLSDLENNKAKNPTIDKLEIIAVALDTTTKDLLTTEDKLDIAVTSVNAISELAKNALQYSSSVSSNDYNLLKELNADYVLNINKIINQFNDIEFTQSECEEINNYIRYVISKRK